MNKMNPDEFPTDEQNESFLNRMQRHEHFDAHEGLLDASKTGRGSGHRLALALRARAALLEGASHMAGRVGQHAKIVDLEARRRAIRGLRNGRGVNRF
jgi:hypothetical protein